MIFLALAEQERQRHREGGNFRRGDGPPDAVCIEETGRRLENQRAQEGRRRRERPWLGVRVSAAKGKSAALSRRTPFRSEIPACSVGIRRARLERVLAHRLAADEHPVARLAQGGLPAGIRGARRIRSAPTERSRAFSV